MLLLITDFVQTIAITLFILLPGFAILNGLGQDKHLNLVGRISLAAAITICLYPLLNLWAYQFNLQIGAQLVWGCSTLGAVFLFWQSRYFFTENGPKATLVANLRSNWLSHALLLVVIALLCWSRLDAIRSMVAPAFGDSVQHTMLAQLFVDNNGLFQSWQPYAPFDTFTYHFGFHLAVANGAWITGHPMPEVTLKVGQMLNVLAVLALYPVAVRFCRGNRWAGIGALIVAGLLSQNPAFYVNWGRYTQLTGQVVLLGLIWTLDRWWNDEERPTTGHAMLLLLFAAGMALTHYRVAILSGGVGLAWTAWGIWRWRHDLAEWRVRFLRLVALALMALCLILPWINIVAQGRLPESYGNMARETVKQPAAYSEIGIWRSLGTYYPIWLWGSGIIALAGGLWRVPRYFIPFALSLAAAFLLTNPYLLQLPGTGWITNFLLIIALYIPLGIAIGWFVGEVSQWIAPNYHWLLASSLLVLALWGGYQQQAIVDPFFQMVTAEDVSAFEWITENTPTDANFAVNGFLAYRDTVIAGSDAGWWLPYYTLRRNTIPPLIGVLESVGDSEMHNRFRQTHIDIQQSGGDATGLQEAFCRYSITHAYLGQRQGTVGFGLLPSPLGNWLAESADFQLLYQVDQAQVWAFDAQNCS